MKGATHPCRTPISLTERIEDEVQLVLRNTDTRVHDAEFKLHSSVLDAHKSTAQRNMTLTSDLARRELDRIADEVRDNLTKTEGVTNELILDVRVHVVREVQVVLRSAHNQCLEDTEDSLPDREDTCSMVIRPASTASNVL